MRLTDLENKAKLLCLSGFRAFVHSLPLKTLHRLAQWSAQLTYRLDRDKRRMMAAELAALGPAALGGGKLAEVVQRGLINIRKDVFEELSLVPDMSAYKLKKLTFFTGLDNLEAGLAQGRGVIILLTHFGFRKIIIPALGYAGYRVHQVATHPLTLAKEDARAAVHNRMMELELEFDRLVPASFIYVENFLRPIYRALEANEIVIFTIDGPVGQKRVALPFFQRQILLPPTPFSLGLKQGVPMLPVFVVRQPDNRHNLNINPPLPTQNPDGKAVALPQIMQAFVSLLEQYVRRHPCHYADYLYRSRLNPITDNMHVFQP